MPSAKPKFFKAGCIGELLVGSTFLGLFLFFGSMIILPQGGTLGRDDIAKNLQHWTEGCAAGGANPKGFAYSEFPDRHRAWYEVNLALHYFVCSIDSKYGK